MKAQTDVGRLAEKQRGDRPVGQLMPEDVARDAAVSVEQRQSNRESREKRPRQIGVLKRTRQPYEADEKGQRDEPDGQIGQPLENGIEETFHEQRDDGRKMHYTLIYRLFPVGNEEAEKDVVCLNHDKSGKCSAR